MNWNIKKILSGLGILMVPIILLAYLLTYSIHRAGQEFVKSYEKADTTIVYRNGKSDTTIVKKTAPHWLR